MSKNKWLRRQQEAGKKTPAPTQDESIGPDAPTIDTEAPPPPALVDGIAPGQIWDDVIVPDRPVNVLQLRPGSKLQPLRVDGPFHDGTGHWMAAFVGESMTKIRVDAAMLKTGRLRA